MTVYKIKINESFSHDGVLYESGKWYALPKEQAVKVLAAAGGKAEAGFAPEPFENGYVLIGDPALPAVTPFSTAVRNAFGGDEKLLYPTGMNLLSAYASADRDTLEGLAMGMWTEGYRGKATKHYVRPIILPVFEWRKFSAGNSRRVFTPFHTDGSGLTCLWAADWVEGKSPLVSPRRLYGCEQGRFKELKSWGK